MYKFIRIPDPNNRHDNSIIVHKVDAESLDELAEAFLFFLRGCGFGGNIKVTIETELEKQDE